MSDEQVTIPATETAVCPKCGSGGAFENRYGCGSVRNAEAFDQSDLCRIVELTRENADLRQRLEADRDHLTKLEAVAEAAREFSCHWKLCRSNDVTALEMFDGFIAKRRSLDDALAALDAKEAT